jgi:hypothetical protein
MKKQKSQCDNPVDLKIMEKITQNKIQIDDPFLHFKGDTYVE